MAIIQVTDSGIGAGTSGARSRAKKAAASGPVSSSAIRPSSAKGPKKRGTPKRRWTDEHIAKLKEVVLSGKTREEAPGIMAAHFGRPFTYWGVVCKASQLNLQWAPTPRANHRRRFFWTDERADWLRHHWRDGTADQLASLATKHFGVTVRSHHISGAGHRLGLTKRRPILGGLNAIEIDAIIHRRQKFDESVESLAECFEVELDVIERVCARALELAA